LLWAEQQQFEVGEFNFEGVFSVQVLSQATMKLQASLLIPMDNVVETLNLKLSQWTPGVAEQVKRYVLEIMELADGLDILRSRQVEQDVLDLIDED
jgi:hypothetical protein